MGSFLDSLKSNIERVLQETNYKLTTVAIKRFSYSINRSPGGATCSIEPGPFVDGEFINNWFPAINGYDTSTTAARDLSGAGSLARLEMLKQGNAFLGKDGFVTLSNNLSYATRVEYKGWPKGKDPDSGWYWTGKALIYNPVLYGENDIKADL
jgi:hypothetical protein